MITQLPPVLDLLPQVKSLTKQIKLAIYTIGSQPTMFTQVPITKDFILAFHKDRATDIYVKAHVLYIPLMSLEKLQGLHKFFQLIDNPYVFEHESVHLLDNRWLSQNTSTYTTTKEMLEDRADALESFLSTKNKD